jgi:acetate---CoA ligase (ADP-forming) subunit beta
VLVNEYESKKQLKAAGINVVATELAVSKDEAVTISQRLGYPVVLKVVSSDIVHKSDAGGVKLGLKSAAEVGQAYQDIMSAVKAKFPAAKVQGISVQQMARPGLEVIVGMYKDAQFGPVLMFGLGGIWVEIMKDVSFKITPLTRQDAADMIREIKAFPLLKGYRGSEPVSLEALEEFILKVGAFVEANPKIKELDLNPVFAYKDGAIAVDARIITED